MIVCDYPQIPAHKLLDCLVVTTLLNFVLCFTCLYHISFLQNRFCRLRNYNTLYICGTDEYGTATETRVRCSLHLQFQCAGANKHNVVLVFQHPQCMYRL